MQIVISASRRTDIPAFYSDWFIDRLGAGYFNLTNPFNGRVRKVRVNKTEVHSIVFWSKNYAPLLSRMSRLKGWRLFFHFTLNSEDTLLEPGVPPLAARCEQMRQLVGMFGPLAVRWRFDPVACYELQGRKRDNLGDFEMLLDFAAGLGLTGCTVSFMDFYRKIEARQKKIPGFRFLYPKSSEMIETASRMAGLAAECGITLFTCCEPELVQAGIENLAPAGCIDHNLLMGLYGTGLSCKADKGQRRASGCLCHESIDIGSYRRQPCKGGCLYCYANPSQPQPPRGLLNRQGG
ncbi:MAG: DUF1848 domain-containing protein [Gemmatimonadota bacterium]|nr:DUF1848 domain-containing protein [Gemmatimonadota bacterium]